MSEVSYSDSSENQELWQSESLSSYQSDHHGTAPWTGERRRPITHSGSTTSTNTETLRMPRPDTLHMEDLAVTPDTQATCSRCSSEPFIFCILCKQLCALCHLKVPEHRRQSDHWLEDYDVERIARLQLQHRVRTLLQAKEKSERAELHRANRDMIWLAVQSTGRQKANMEPRPGESGSDPSHASQAKAISGLTFQFSDRFDRLVQAHCDMKGISECYPQLISFIGNTCAGKSGLIAALIDHAMRTEPHWLMQRQAIEFNLPVVGDISDEEPTSGNAHLYRGGLTSNTGEGQPLLFLDSEGINGAGSGEGVEAVNETEQTDLQRTTGEETEPPLDGNGATREDLNGNNRGPASLPAGEVAAGTINPGRLRKVAEALKARWSGTLNLSNGLAHRSEAVDRLFPKLLYSCSDVFVYVMAAADIKQMAAVFLPRIMSWAQSSQTASLNRVVLPHLIVVLNKSNCQDSWSTEITTKHYLGKDLKTLLSRSPAFEEILQPYLKAGIQLKNVGDLLKLSYSTVKFIQVPDFSQPGANIEQLGVLHSEIAQTARLSLKEKFDAGLALSSNSMAYFHKLAFGHFSKFLDRPFDFVQAYIASQPSIGTLGSQISRLLRSALGIVNKFGQQQGEDIRVSHFCDNMVPVVGSTIALALSRQREIAGAGVSLANLFHGTASTSQRAETQDGEANDKDNESYKRRVERALENALDMTLVCDFDSHGRHCAVRRIAHKRHVDESNKIIEEGTFKSRFGDLLKIKWNPAMRSMLEDLSATFNGYRFEEREAAIWALHVANLELLFQKMPNFEIQPGVMCCWCLQNAVTETLPCRHGMCDTCVRQLGTAFPRDPRAFALEMCRLHHSIEVFDPPINILLLPPRLRRRVLALDGRGVKASVGAKLLAELESRTAGNRENLPISAFFDLIGGTGASGLVALSLGTCRQTANGLVQDLETFLKKIFTPHSSWKMYPVERLADSINLLFGALCGRSLMGCREPRGGGAGTKVFVTATKGPKAGIITNYNRVANNTSVASFLDLSASHGPATIRDVATVTMALPGYFKDIKFGPFDTYYDGSNLLPNPAKTALDEAKAIWPLAADQPVDMLVSIGSGKQDEESWGQWLTFWSSSSRKRLNEMITDDVWTTDFPHSQTTTGRFVRLNPSMKVALPSDDDLDSGESLDATAWDYIETKTVLIDTVARKLLASSFYFQLTEKRLAHENCIAKGKIMCRFIMGSQTMKAFASRLQEMDSPRIEYRSKKGKVRIEISNMLENSVQTGILELPIVLDYFKGHAEVWFADGAGHREYISGFPCTIQDLD